MPGKASVLFWRSGSRYGEEDELRMKKIALITGITGQDGSYLAELLLDKGYEVVGMMRRSSTLNFERIAHIQGDITLVSGDLLDEASLMTILREYRPNEVYNLAAPSSPRTLTALSTNLRCSTPSTEDQPIATIAHCPPSTSE